MKVVGFSQLRNELELGNLENWFKCMEPCDEIYIYDQNSTDGSKEYYKKFPNTHVIESSINNFSQELKCKAELLRQLLKEHPDTDWVYWMDGDTLMDGRFLENNGSLLRELLSSARDQNIDGIFLGHYNLWRSDVWHRVDDQYDHFMHAGRMVFWRNNGRLSFPEEEGLHKSQHPIGIQTAVRVPFNLIHRGFATDEQLLYKYNLYKERGQTGWALDRLLKEDGLEVKRVPQEEIPAWLEVGEQDPREKEKLKEIYDKK